MKTPHTLLRLLSAAALAAVLAHPAAAQVDLSRLVWIGDSEGAGVSAACLTKRVQVDSPGAVIARANGADFQQPIINDPGQGGCMVLTSLAPSFGAEPSTGTPANLTLPRPYNNLAIPGCTVHDMLYATTGADRGGCSPLIDLILRNSTFKIGSQVDQAISLNPSFVIFADFGNEYLGAVTSGTAIDGVTLTPTASYATDLNAALAKLKAIQPKGIVTGVVDVTNIPFTTTIPPYVTSGGKLVLVGGAPIPLLGPKGCPAGVPACPIPNTTLVTLAAASYMPLGYGIPCAVAPLPKCNNPLPDSSSAAGPGVLLYADEVTLLKTRGAEYNAAAKAAAAASGYLYYDPNDLLARAKAGFGFGGATVSAAYLTGGMFSYDAIHLTPIGYALLADDMIKFINASFPASLKEPDLSVYLFQGGTAGGLSGGTVPYAWAPMTDAEKATAIEQIFTLDFSSKLAAMFPAHRAAVSPGPSAPVQRHERADRTDPMP
ncbi:MAG TPA: hypothetical protein VGM13_12425 [Thermoanaerobaculia bacterium]|jgi:hypothetical protein